uniref:UVR domain-containing protein n=1 Tax=Cyclophora tenuis TaxID=216820 RepID=A0A7S1GQR3_CYCTE|mmetsp:Transcript_7466/g.12939  ORF Transcript_7466/g.12939 Transcript_7466/m.12939 type:complete len:489 (+) Transcript_7466:3-1469(+)
MMDVIKKEIGLAGSFQFIVSTEISFNDARTKDEEQDEELAQLQADVVKSEASVTEASTVLKATEAALVDLDAERKRLEAKIPKLEMEKKSSAAKRDFKAASRASKEIKEATARLEKLETELIGQAKDRRAKAQAELSKVQEEMESTKSRSDAKERESGRVAMDKVAEKIRHLLAVKKKECGAQTEGRGIQPVGALILKKQINALKLEGGAYGDKFGGWDEIAATLADDEEGETKGKGETKQDSTEVTATDTKEIKPARAQDEVDPEVVSKARQLTKKLLEAESALEAAVAQEDYDKAAELDPLFQELQADIEALNLTEAETELVMTVEDVSATPEPEDSMKEEEEKATAEKEEKEEEEEKVVETEEEEKEAEEHHEKVADEEELKETAATEGAEKEEETEEEQQTPVEEVAGEPPAEEEEEPAKENGHVAVENGTTHDKEELEKAKEEHDSKDSDKVQENGTVGSEDKEEFFDAEEEAKEAASMPSEA